MVIQDLRLSSHNIKFILERYFSASLGRTLDAGLPQGYQGSEFGPELKAFLFLLYFQGRVPQNKIEKILTGMNVSITDSEISRLILRRQEDLEQEHEQARVTALRKANFVQVDDTGARIFDRNASTVVTSNPYFCHYLTSFSKDRLSVIQALSGNEEPQRYLINRTSLRLLKGKVAKKHLKTLNLGKAKKLGKLLSQAELEQKLARMPLLPKPSREEILTACAIAAYRFQKRGEGPLILVSDDASNFKGLFTHHHQLCWVHEIRHYRTIYTIGTYQQSLIDDHLDQMQAFYKRLKRYKLHPTKEEKEAIPKQFDELFTKTTPMNALNEQLGLTMKRKKGLLQVLKHPFVPLHNNESETDLRERVLKRKISYGNRSWAGVKAWDLHLALLHTCRKLNISYWSFLKDRFQKKYEIPQLHRIIQAAA